MMSQQIIRDKERKQQHTTERMPPRLKSDLNSMPILLQLWIHRARAFDSKFAYILPCIIVKGVAPQCIWRGAYRESVFCRAVKASLSGTATSPKSWRLRFFLFQVDQPSTSGSSASTVGDQQSSSDDVPSGGAILKQRLLAPRSVSRIAF